MNPEYNRRTHVARQFANDWLTSHHYSTTDAATTECDAAATAMRDALDSLNGRSVVNEQSLDVIFGNISERLSFVYRLGPIASDQLAAAAINAALNDTRTHAQ